MKKRVVQLALAAALVVSSASAVFALEVPARPTVLVNDTAGILSAEYSGSA
ncbi:MAG: hypothetical protein AAB538_02665 [Patescibacteria group bacterium]